jgi:precorrin-2 dehydrogenase/sirohydrochlorin ferrochelatase
MNLFPAFLKLAGRPCLVVGAGPIAEEKIEGLLRAGAEVLVVAPKATARIRKLARAKKIRWQARRFRTNDLDGVFLVVAATSSGPLHDEIYKQARRRGILCNVVDDPPNCDFYYGSIVQRGSLQIAISTAGQSPALAQRIRKKLEQQFGAEYERWIEELGRTREALFAKPMDSERRKRLLHRLANQRSFSAFRRKQKGRATKKAQGVRKAIRGRKAIEDSDGFH